VIVNGVNGWLETRPEKLVEPMRELIRNPDLARRWGQAARRTAEERFGIARFVADWDRVLRHAAGASLH
jgi:glycosyltransferase involved in cell wall biosynthesis